MACKHPVIMFLTNINKKIETPRTPFLEMFENSTMLFGLVLSGKSCKLHIKMPVKRSSEQQECAILCT